MTHEEPALVSDRWPRLAAELADALREEGEDDLAEQAAGLRVLQQCDCGDDFCQSFYTQPPPDGAYGPGHRNIGLSPEKPGMLVLDVVDTQIMYVEVIDRPPLR
ncbi:hypothetical protein BJ973_002739 [Actinoplanes tereljensis]|uniref:Uncharacterized protein n=1 Tax=Paractinoplanes tereljensis TaxID=571912 RepID=A0A919TU50_9ACTN|nr:hypothetical protein [Actinoplanes tereljensis]GIF22416.1 hypothetical protein Ate02nite_51460 [Actinoplanes tereljensis]